MLCLNNAKINQLVSVFQSLGLAPVPKLGWTEFHSCLFMNHFPACYKACRDAPHWGMRWAVPCRDHYQSSFLIMYPPFPFHIKHACFFLHFSTLPTQYYHSAFSFPLLSFKHSIFWLMGKIKIWPKMSCFNISLSGFLYSISFLLIYFSNSMDWEGWKWTFGIQMKAREREMGEYTESKQINDLRQSSYHVIK